MDILNQVGVTTRADIEQEYFINSLINYLNGIDISNTIITDKVLSEFSSKLDEHLELEVPTGLRPTDVRRDKLLNKFYATLEFIMKRDLSRILSLYSWVENIYTKIENDNNSKVEEIVVNIQNTINKLLKMNASNSVVNNMHIFNLQDLNEIITNTGNHFQYSGIVMPNLITQDSEVNVIITSSSDCYTVNKYVTYNTDTTQDITIDTIYYNYTNEIFTLNLDFTAEVAFNNINIELDVPFNINSITTNEDGHTVNITENILGNGIYVEGSKLIHPSNESTQISGNNYKYVIFSPSKLLNATVNITLPIRDTQLVSLGSVLNQHGDVIHSYDLYDSLLLSKRLSGEEHTERILEIQKEVHQGNVIFTLENQPFRHFNVQNITTQIINNITPSVVRFRTIVTSKYINSIELWVDDVDPNYVITYKIDPGTGNYINISPVNSNRDDEFKITFDTMNINQFELIAEIIPDGTYIPTINGIVLRVSEKSI